MKPLISKKLFNTLANKYLIAFMVFSVWMIFIDDNNIFFLRKNVNKLKEYRVEKAYFLEKIRNEKVKLVIPESLYAKYLELELSSRPKDPCEGRPRPN